MIVLASEWDELLRAVKDRDTATIERIVFEAVRRDPETIIIV
jgi:hypothetical protein